MGSEGQKNDLDKFLNEPIAIVGMGCQFPGIDSDVEEVAAFFEMLLQGQSPIKEVPKKRWSIEKYYDPDRKKVDKTVGRKGGFLADSSLFDAAFFKISPVEAKQIDPQHRLFLEVSIRALNHANIRLDSLNNTDTAVFCGTSAQDYSQLNYKDQIEFNAYTQIGSASSAGVGRLSHFLNLKGPSIAVDTACSSSLSALYLAVMALRAYQCSLAIVGGVHLNLCPENFIGFTKANMLSAKDQCSSFDSQADGFVKSEGCGVIVVKRLSDALRDKDRIHALIKSIVMTQDGNEGIALVAPNINSQIALHQQALAQAKLKAGDIDYVEAHGTGTVAGDSVEFNALKAIHQGQHSQGKPLIIGALKSNLGHGIASSGIASLIKAVCALQHEKIPPNLHYSRPGSTIKPESIPALFPVKTQTFARLENKKRYAQVANFGFSGTNVTVVMEEPKATIIDSSHSQDNKLHCFVVSANSEYSLKQILANYRNYLKDCTASLGDICYTLINCRDHFKYRLAILAKDKYELLKKIDSKEYELKKVAVDEAINKLTDDARQIYEAYLSGATIRVEGGFNKVELPSYVFDRKSYWHAARTGSQEKIRAAEVVRQPVIKVLNKEPIAIIGMACRLPKAASITEFLSLLEQGENGMVDIPLDRWDNEKYYDADLEAPGRLYVKQLGLINDIRNFDADFFKVSPREAKMMSPQLRIFLETSYHALEDANLPLDQIKDSRTGVFAGCGTNEYPHLLLNQGLGLENLNIYYATGNVLNAVPGRVAYTFDFHGPIQAIDTACSSSMTAIHNACLSLQAGDCDMALAGGINTLLAPDSNVTLSKARMLSPESRCKTFSDDADGYARSEGCGVVVLKRLSTAIEDGDTLAAVIKGSAINSDGKSGGFTVPNGMAQEEVIRAALAKAQLSPADIDFIETHGTGTPLADPIEVQTLTKIFSDYHSLENPLYLGSVKTNIGHCESASGVAGVIKAVLSLQAKKLFKHLNFKKLNPEIELKNTVIPLSTIAWHSAKGLRYAGVSSFGFSGANAHLILQEAPPEELIARQLPEESLLVLSAKSKESLELLLASYQHYLAKTKDELADICYTAATCRSHFLFRVAIWAKTAKEAAELIKNNEYRIYQIKKEQKAEELAETQLQTAYQEGIQINWLARYQSLGIPFVKVKLPLYEFNRKEYWFNDKEKLNDVPLPKDWCFQVQWQPQPLAKIIQKIPNKKWLLMGAKNFAANLGAQGLTIVLEEENEPLANLDGIIFAVGLDLPVERGIEASIHFQKELIKKLLNLVKQLNQEQQAPQLIVLTTNAIAELAVGELNFNNSPLLGFCKTLVLELPEHKTILIDSDRHEEPLFAAKILREISYNHGNDYEHLVAYREGKRMVPRLKKSFLAEQKISLKSEGRYLITGGLGGLGLITAQALLSAGARELILCARNVDKPEPAEAIKKMLAAYQNAVIRPVSVDLSNKDELAGLLMELNRDGLLKGIIHTAGAAIKAPLLEHQEKDVDYLFSAKVKGGWYLHELSQACQLDFFIVYSSVASVFGSNREAVYSATNSFLDSLIAERRRLGLIGNAIQWGPWAEVGMAKERSRSPELKAALIDKELGYSFIKALLNGQQGQITIISPDYLKFMLAFVPQPLPMFHKVLANDIAGSIAAGNQSLSPWLSHYLDLAEEKRFDACKTLLATICKEILELSSAEELSEDEGFFELGFDSLMITEMAGQLKRRLSPFLKVTVAIGFNYPSINKLAKYIEAELNEQIANRSAIAPVIKQEEDSIAIIGMSCNLPNAPDLAAFEHLLEKGLSGIQDIPLERWDNSKYYDPDPEAPRKSYVSKLGLIDNLKGFDANFFGISPREARLMEPQQRLFLENCYKALENANYPASSLGGSLTGVYTGVGPNEYFSLLEKSEFHSDELSVYSITGNVLNLIPSRVAYTFDFKGPTISVDTACSSSLVALHYACQSLKNHEIDYALSGGVNILLRPESNITLCKAKALSPDGQCKTFDAEADGYARAEGCAVVFLKRTADAIRDKDHILAVIKASAINNDGKSAGLTVPNGQSQEKVMRTALSQTGLLPEDINYIEAHGTGTSLGDPIEVQAINEVYGNPRRQDNPLYLGTVKTNIGHLESASGLTGLIKTVIGLQKKKIYKILNFKSLNPNIRLNGTRIALEKIDWQPGRNLRTAGVNAFGFSGTNAHFILQEYPEEEKRPKTVSDKSHLLLLSAKSKTALERLARRYQQYLATTAEDFGDICFTSATCRDHYPYRLVLSARSALEASQILAEEQAIRAVEQLPKLGLQQEANLEALAINYLQGKKIDWLAYYKTCGQFKKTGLPNYSFEKTEFWVDRKSENFRPKEEIHPLLGQKFAMPGHEYLFRNELDLENLTYIKQHALFGKMVFPAVAYIESGLAIAKSLFKQGAFQIEKFNIRRPLYPKQGQEFQFQVKPKTSEQYKINIFARQDEDWQVFSEMEIQAQLSPVPEIVDLDALKHFLGEKVELSQIYENFKKRALLYGDEFHVLQEGYVKSDEVLAKVALNKTGSGQDYYYPPVLLDGAIQSILLLGMNNTSNTTYVPYSFTRMTAFQEATRSFWAYVRRLETGNQNELCVDIKLYDNRGLLIAEIAELKLRVVTSANFVSYEFLLQHLYQTKWSSLRSEQAVKTKPLLPEFFVIAQDEAKAKKYFANLNYQVVQPGEQWPKLEDKHVVFLYEQGQIKAFFHCYQNLFQSRPKSFVLVTENAYAIADKDRVNPYHTMASSLWRAASNELGLDNNYTVDLGTGKDLDDALNYIYTAKSPEKQFALRDSIYIPRLGRKQLAMSQSSTQNLFSAENSYLIVGGTGGLARLLIDYLIRSGVKHLVLSSRSKCPIDILALMEQVKEKGVFIRHVEVDAANYRNMENLISELAQASHPLKGVFHLAGLVDDGLLVNLDDEKLQSVLSAKSDSALILHQLTQNLSLDHFVLFSSSASVFGARGQANYVAANGFLDGLAHLRQRLGLPAIAINWGPFQSVGMTATLTQALQANGFIPLEKEQIDILDLLLQSGLAQIAPCPMNWDLYDKHAAKQSLFSELIRTAAPAGKYFLNTLRQQGKDARVAILSEALSEITAEILSLDDSAQIKGKDDLFAMGLDSLMAIEIRNRIFDKLQDPTLSLPIEYFINEPSIDKIANYIAECLELGLVDATSEDLVSQAIPKPVTLCDFQYLFWVINQMGNSFNIGMQLRLHGPVNKDFLYQAFEAVINQHNAFWISFDEDAPIQQLNKKGRFELIYNDISLSNQGDALNQAFYKNVMSLIPLTRQPLIRVYFYQINNELGELHLIIPHIIVDDVSCEIVFSQFKKAYECLVLGKRLVSLPANDAYFNFVKQNNFHYEKDLKEKHNFWQAYNRGFRKLNFGQANHLPSTVYQEKYLFHYPLEEFAFKQFIAWHQTKNINVSTGLIAVCHLAFYKITQQKKIPLILIHSGREGGEYKATVGLFSEYKRINLSLDEDDNFIASVRAIEEQLLKTAPYQKCSHFIKESGLEGEGLSIGQYLMYQLNQFFLAKSFKKTKLNPTIINNYLKQLTVFKALRKTILIKNSINKILGLNLPLTKPVGLRVLLSMTPSLFSKEPANRRFADLEYSFPNHFACSNRPIGNQTLWVYFSRNQDGDCQLSINGPLTQACKDQLALEVNKIIVKFAEKNEQTIKDLIGA